MYFLENFIGRARHFTRHANERIFFRMEQSANVSGQPDFDIAHMFVWAALNSSITENLDILDLDLARLKTKGLNIEEQFSGMGIKAAEVGGVDWQKRVDMVYDGTQKMLSFTDYLDIEVYEKVILQKKLDKVATAANEVLGVVKGHQLN